MLTEDLAGIAMAYLWYVCVVNLPTDTSVGSSFHVIACLAITFLLLLCLDLLLKEK